MHHVFLTVSIKGGRYIRPAGVADPNLVQGQQVRGARWWGRLCLRLKGRRGGAVGLEGSLQSPPVQLGQHLPSSRSLQIAERRCDTTHGAIGARLESSRRSNDPDRRGRVHREHRPQDVDERRERVTLARRFSQEPDGPIGGQRQVLIRGKVWLFRPCEDVGDLKDEGHCLLPLERHVALHQPGDRHRTFRSRRRVYRGHWRIPPSRSTIHSVP